MTCACGQPLTLQDRGLFWAATEADVQAWAAGRMPAHAVHTAAACGVGQLRAGGCQSRAGRSTGAALSIPAAALALGVSVAAVHRGLAAGTLRGVKVRPHPRGWVWRVFIDEEAT